MQAEFAGQSAARFFGGEAFEQAIQLSLLSVLCFSAAVGWAARWLAPVRSETPTAELRQLRPGILFGVWLVLSLARELTRNVMAGSGLVQISGPFLVLSMAAMLLLFQYSFSTGRQWGLTSVLLGMEIVNGFLGFFSSFKTVIFVFVAGGMTFVASQRKIWPVAILMLVLALGLGNFWQTIKSDYRRFVAGEDEGQQTINMPIEERAKYLARAVDGLDWAGYQRGMDMMLERFGYTTFFGYCIQNVPAGVPHARGRLWGEALAHVFMPRFLFPDKQVFNDSDRTNEFTGIRVADADEGASIGIGYVAESYVDFGVPGMFIPIFLFGLAVGGGYGLIVRSAPNYLLGAAFGTAMLMRSGFYLESSNAKMLGSLVIAVAIYTLVLKFGGRRIWRFITVPVSSPSVRP
ncbi:MAG: hypothetical protein EBS05_12345 [Proteobacteria bacterium]|nr:hypothetical protein [Pseudomonadota bacterium]